METNTKTNAWTKFQLPFQRYKLRQWVWNTVSASAQLVFFLLSLVLFFFLRLFTPLFYLMPLSTGIACIYYIYSLHRSFFRFCAIKCVCARAFCSHNKQQKKKKMISFAYDEMVSVPLQWNYIEQVFIIYLFFFWFNAFYLWNCGVPKQWQSDRIHWTIRLSLFLASIVRSFLLVWRSHFEHTHTHLPLWSMFFSLHGVIDRWRLFDREATKIYNHDFHTSSFSRLSFFLNLLLNQTLVRGFNFFLAAFNWKTPRTLIAWKMCYYKCVDAPIYISPLLQ